MGKYARLDAFTRGQIWGLRQAGKDRPQIRRLVKKKDGKHPTLRTVDNVLSKKKGDPSWHGENSSAGGRTPSLSAKEIRELTSLVFKERGKAVVTAPYCMKRLPFLRDVTKQTVRNALHAAGLAWLRRRQKAAVPKKYLEPRKRYCKWILRQGPAFLKQFAYTDGAAFYLARGPEEQEGKQRAALGACVWRLASGKDGLWDENVGPSLCAKAQGLPVKIWGLFADGALYYYVLPKDKKRKTTNMNAQRYKHLVQTKFAQWRRQAFRSKSVRPHLVQDHERCLWKVSSLKALKAAGFHVLKDYPPYSPDLNAIEGWWRRLRQRLEQTAPTEHECRADFLKRLRRTVNRMNVHCRAEGRKLCRNQKERANDVLALKGAKCKW